MSKQDGGPAFGSCGMSKREFFAAVAMHAFMGDKRWLEAAEEFRPKLGPRDALATAAFDVADSMLKVGAMADDSPLPPDVLDLGDKNKVGRS